LRRPAGDFATGDLAGGCQVKTASGDLRIGRLSGGRAQLETVTGDIEVAVARGALVAVDAATVSGSVRSEIDLDAEEPGPTGPDEPPRLELHARTVSGDLRIERAAMV
jgi:Putative adhesin